MRDYLIFDHNTKYATHRRPFPAIRDSGDDAPRKERENRPRLVTRRQFEHMSCYVELDHVCVNGRLWCSQRLSASVCLVCRKNAPSWSACAFTKTGEPWRGRHSHDRLDMC